MKGRAFHWEGQSIPLRRPEHSIGKSRAFHWEGQSIPLGRAEHSTEKGGAFHWEGQSIPLGKVEHLSPHGRQCKCLLTGTPNSVSFNLSRKFKTLLQDSFFWHPATSTQHLSWKNCTGFPFQNVLKSLVCVSML